MFKLIVIILLVAVIVQMALGLKAMYRKDSNKDVMARALTWRVGLSISLFLLLLLGIRLGWITPN
ncbi:MAG: DUF2909 domain-containing protein [Gammaproteobacteria bacterium]|nr:MAG: DUF2909 domain-containing protein [Gammaproteobacteria bacterium]RLA12183.1 MAG: DUF2909 domain-containing protein [Gammaproteobacteria bacterium]RLA17152.1 MAG: DUF2909 domain-containing protein [Gammaproteobacteria bacterium]